MLGWSSARSLSLARFSSLDPVPCSVFLPKSLSMLSFPPQEPVPCSVFLPRSLSTLNFPPQESVPLLDFLSRILSLSWFSFPRACPSLDFLSQDLVPLSVFLPRIPSLSWFSFLRASSSLNFPPQEPVPLLVFLLRIPSLSQFSSPVAGQSWTKEGVLVFLLEPQPLGRSKGAIPGPGSCCCGFGRAAFATAQPGVCGDWGMIHGLGSFQGKGMGLSVVVSWLWVLPGSGNGAVSADLCAQVLPG